MKRSFINYKLNDMKEEKQMSDWTPAPEDNEAMKASGQWEAAEGYYDESSYVNFGWVVTLSTVLLVIGALALIAGVIFVLQSFDAYTEGYGVIGAALLASGLVALFMGALLKVLVQIERNTRL